MAKLVSQTYGEALFEVAMEEQKTDIFLEEASDKMLGFIKLVVKKERYNELPKIFRYLVDRIKEEKKIGIAYVTTAVELSDAKKQNVEI